MMNGSFESCVSCSLVVVTFILTLCQGPGQNTAQACNLNARPHRNGLCGEDLAQAHANLCFLLSIAYPEVFGKRSSSSSSLSSSPSSESLPSSFFLNGAAGHHKVTGQGHPRARRAEPEDDLLERIYRIPLSVLAKLDINEENWRSVVYKRGMENSMSPHETRDEVQFNLKDLEELPAGPTRTLVRMLSKRSPPTVNKRTVGLVCECCINSCLPRQMATYC